MSRPSVTILRPLDGKRKGDTDPFEQQTMEYRFDRIALNCEILTLKNNDAIYRLDVVGNLGNNRKNIFNYLTSFVLSKHSCNSSLRLL